MSPEYLGARTLLPELCRSGDANARELSKMRKTCGQRVPILRGLRITPVLTVGANLLLTISRRKTSGMGYDGK